MHRARAAASTERTAHPITENAMSAQQDYWKECMAIAADECELKLEHS